MCVKAHERKTAEGAKEQITDLGATEAGSSRTTQRDPLLERAQRRQVGWDPVDLAGSLCRLCLSLSPPLPTWLLHFALTARRQEEGDQGGGGGGIHCAWAAAKAPLRGWEEAGSSCRDCGEPSGVAQGNGGSKGESAPGASCVRPRFLGSNFLWHLVEREGEERAGALMWDAVWQSEDAARLGDRGRGSVFMGRWEGVSLPLPGNRSSRLGKLLLLGSDPLCALPAIPL